jgi:hypothetical protein
LFGNISDEAMRGQNLAPFYNGLPEFSAVMRDKRFLAALKDNHVRENLRTGIRMTLRLAIKEHKVGDVWLVKRGGRSVVEVISPEVN